VGARLCDIWVQIFSENLAFTTVFYFSLGAAAPNVLTMDPPMAARTAAAGGGAVAVLRLPHH